MYTTIIGEICYLNVNAHANAIYSVSVTGADLRFEVSSDPVQGDTVITFYGPAGLMN